MGKPFKSELLKLDGTYNWVAGLNLESLRRTITKINSPIYFVGSGGSLSACYFGVALSEKQGKFAKAITPLELYSLKNTIRNTSIIFISASGRNTDILFGFKTAIKYEAKLIVSICMQKNSKLAELSKKYSISKVYEFLLPVGKDGFLATNSLIAYFTILNKVFNFSTDKFNFLNSAILKKIDNFVESLTNNSSITVLYNGFSKSVAYDIESKSVEAALYPILLSDFRNFGHGRHHWFAKKKDSAAIIALANPNDRFLAEKTLNELPNYIPKLLLNTDNINPIGSLDLLQQSFYLIDKFGESLGIDPGRPGVPAFGRKLYHLKYAKALTDCENDLELSSKSKIAISRKNEKPISSISKSEIQIWLKSYNDFVNRINKANFGAIVFDYDGTICSASRKFEGPDEVMANKLKNILENGFYISVVTGRGKSVRIDLQKILPKKYWNQVMIGYYNGSEVGFLENNLIPNRNLKNNGSLDKLFSILNVDMELEVDYTLRPNQLTIEFKNEHNILDLKEIIIQKVKLSGQKDIEILESSHSIDIIPSYVSKTDALDPLRKVLAEKQLATDILCIGDRGKWPGNDFKLLNTLFSLSVFEINKSKSTCWNIAPPGITHIKATMYYLDCLKFESSKMKLKISK